MLSDRSPLAIALLGAGVLGILAIGAVSIGSVGISPGETIRVLVNHVLPVDIDTSPIADPIIWNIRLPRVATAVGAGLALGLAGVVLQGLFRNPVADPHLTGVSAVASIGVLLGLLIGWDAFGPVAGVLGGAVAGILGALFVRTLARAAGPDPSRLILIGIGFGLAVTAVVAAASIALNDPRIPDTEFWFVGGLAGATWGVALWTSVAALAGAVVVFPHARALDVLSLGDGPARNIGVNVDRVARVALAATGVAVGAAVGAAGVVAFVGLLGAHIARRLVGPHHRRLLIAGAVAGGAVLVACDAIGRLIGGRFEVPVGLITAAIGGPYLVWLVVTRKINA